jgi:hypothetical protein
MANVFKIFKKFTKSILLRFHFFGQIPPGRAVHSRFFYPQKAKKSLIPIAPKVQKTPMESHFVIRNSNSYWNAQNIIIKYFI